MKLILFDIDGTLIMTGGAGFSAMTSAFQKILGLEEALNGTRLDGMTDPLIIQRVLNQHGLEPIDDATTELLYEAYLDFLADQLEGGADRYRVLAGVRPLLDTLKDRGYALGLATGNIEKGARLKLEPGGLNRYFRFGGYGSDSHHRADLISTAIERGKIDAGVKHLDSTVVVGDTPNDILHGREAGCRVVGVASGSYGAEALKQYDPDLLLSTLEEVDTFTRFLDEI